MDKALDLLIDEVMKERFAVGRKPRQPSAPAVRAAPSRHIPNAIQRKVFERDGGRCTFVEERGRRCAETGNLEFDHLDGWALTHLHDVDRIRLLCRAHNQHAAEQTYGRAFIRASTIVTSPDLFWDGTRRVNGGAAPTGPDRPADIFTARVPQGRVAPDQLTLKSDRDPRSLCADMEFAPTSLEISRGRSHQS